MYTPRFGIHDPATFAIQLEPHESAFPSGKAGVPLPPRYPNDGSYLQTQRRHHGTNPRLLRCRLRDGRRPKVDLRLRLPPRQISRLLASEETDDSRAINGRIGVCGYGTRGKGVDLATIPPSR